ncbi:hypothetical protein B0T25DRAFT_195498 [Lasiosphaeria hispida]|uniref:Uncharacterized protein n=1 Tax=Lasiosphaeria hispida TaxID=260671 RepID=A0AAJ0HHM8_9PEZI|nr:hypothetical protein B0T25DRAFT_195498 [Lasiosphaeria hispida]
MLTHYRSVWWPTLAYTMSPCGLWSQPPPRPSPHSVPLPHSSSHMQSTSFQKYRHSSRRASQGGVDGNTNQPDARTCGESESTRRSQPYKRPWQRKWQRGRLAQCLFRCREGSSIRASGLHLAVGLRSHPHNPMGRVSARIVCRRHDSDFLSRFSRAVVSQFSCGVAE